MRKFIDFDSNNPQVIDRSKNIVFIAAAIFILAIISILAISSEGKKNELKLSNNGKIKKIDIASTFSTNVEKEWLARSENDLKDLMEQNKKLTEELNLLKIELEKRDDTNNKVIMSLADQVAKTQQRLSFQEENNNNIHMGNGSFSNDYGEVIPQTNGILSITIDLEEETDKRTDNSKDLEDYIPAGSYATAKMLSGADVSTGVQNQNDPNNMMFEVISPAYAPKFKGNSQEIKKIEGCRIMASAIGQLWTEKTYIRLLKMICSFEKGKVTEFNVKGYVTSFAKEGVRGKVVSREGYFTSMAFLAGAVEGLADVAKTAYSPTLELQTGIATQHIKGADMAKQASASGLGKAGEMLSDYYIKRAEQYQSVIDVPTGVEVEIVFQEGIDLKKSIGFGSKIINDEVKNNLTSTYYNNDNRLNNYNNGGGF